MKKKLVCLFAAVLFGMLFLCSCGGGEDYAFTASDDRFWYDGYVYSMNMHGILTYCKSSESEEIPLCYDPLCEHLMEDCFAFAPGAREIIATRNRDGAVCVYYTESVFHDDLPAGVWPIKYRICCINVQTGEKTVVLNERTEETTAFFLYGNDMYIRMRGYTKNEEGKSVPQSQLWKMSVDGSNLTQLPTSEYKINTILAIAEVKGRTVIYWEDYYDNRTLYVSPEDFSEKTKVVENLTTYGRVVDGDYLYYAISGSTVAPEIRVEAHPEDKNRNPDGTHTLYPETQLAAYYRLDLTNPESAPELIYDGTSGFYVDAELLWANGDKVYVIPHDPVFLEVLDAYAAGNYVCTETDPLRIPVQYDYVSARSGMKIIEIDLVTGERRGIATPGLDPWRIMGGDDEKIVVRGQVMDIDRICENIVEKGISPGKEFYSFWETREIPLNP